MPLNSAAPTPTRTTALGEVAFDTPLHGWAAGSTCADTCALLFATTDDGGTTWTNATEIGSVAASGNAVVTTHVRFSGQNGWIFGPGIFDTHDGGRTWANAYGGSIAALEAVGTSAWALTGCANQVGACAPTLLVSAVGTDQWSKAPVQPPIEPLAGGNTYTRDATLERSPNNVSFLADQGQLLVSRDVGRSWQILASPCPQIAGVRSLDGISVWVVCSEIVGVHAEASKQVYVSGDGGRTWQLRADNHADVISGSSRTIPIDGYIDAFVQTAPSVALYGSEYGSGVTRTSDSGRRWHGIDISDPCIDAGNPVSQLWFVNPLAGWAVAQSVGDTCPALLASHDGPGFRR